MTQNRREFVRNAATVTGLALASTPLARGATLFEQEVEKASKSLRILILGGTGFIGPNQVRYALKRGHQLTLFNRGKTNPGLFPDVEHLKGDRNDDLEALKGREWDVVIDNPSTLPRWVRQSAQLLKDSAQHYMFVSTVSVYSDNSIVGMDETAPVGKLEDLDDPTTEEVTGESYGPLKAAAEREAQKAFPGKTTVVRPGLIVGPGDRSDRFTYWPVRIDRGGEVIAPGSPDDPNQIIDARDLGEWMIRMAESQVGGVYNATGPWKPLNMAQMLYGIKAASSSDVWFTWIDADFLEGQKVRAWVDMPTWIPPKEGYEGFSRMSIARALKQGLTFRPLAVTAKDTLDWFKSLPEERQAKLRFGLSAEREAEVLKAWHSRG
jgi:2'-hydroxyisoflavone reductase